jgi:hypothetical protein
VTTRLCPAIQCVPVELLDQGAEVGTSKGANKVSLKRYRDASFEVMKVLKDFISLEKFERVNASC